MATKNRRKSRASAKRRRDRPDRLVRRSSIPPAVEIASAVAAGGAAGAIAGPGGAIAGAVVGGLVGIAANRALEIDQAAARERNEQLDRDIGVVDGPIGAARPDQPPVRIGAFSAASLGVRGTEAPDSEGPIQTVDPD